MFGTVRSGILPARSNRGPSAAGMTPSGTYLISVLRSIFSGMAGLPQSRPWENDQSRVTIRPLAPAFLARSARAARVSRSPTQYIWKKVFSLASRTSSIERLANELSPIAVPAFFAARATATSPSGSTACTPVGEMITGIERSWPITVVDRSFSNGRSHTCGRNSSSRNAADVVLEGRPRLAAGHQRAVDRLRQLLLRPPLGLGDRLEPLTSHVQPSGSRDLLHRSRSP